MLIREFRSGDEPLLWKVFFTSVHELASIDYSPEQLEAWAPRDHNESQWSNRVHGIQPFVAEDEGDVVGYADLQPSGYIDHFFVAGWFARRSVGNALMGHIHQAAHQRGITELTSDVSLTAEKFFAKHGFKVESRNSPVIRSITLSNARMRKRLLADDA